MDGLREGRWLSQSLEGELKVELEPELKSALHLDFSVDGDWDFFSIAVSREWEVDSYNPEPTCPLKPRASLASDRSTLTSWSLHWISLDTDGFAIQPGPGATGPTEAGRVWRTPLPGLIVFLCNIKKEWQYQSGGSEGPFGMMAKPLEVIV